MASRRPPDTYRVVDALPLATVVAGWKGASAGVDRWRDFPHRTLVLTTAGRGWYADRLGRRFDLLPGHVLALFPGVAHAFGAAEGATWDESFLILGGDGFADWFSPGLFAPDRPLLRVAGEGYWQRRFAAVAPDPDPTPPYATVARAHQLLADLLAAARAGEAGSAAHAWLAQAKELLGDAARLPLALVARRLGCSEQVLRKRFRALAGIAPGAFREQARLEAACRLLRTRPVAEVADALGYCDQFHFSRRFRQRFGIPPRAFRQVVGAEAARLRD